MHGCLQKVCHAWDVDDVATRIVDTKNESLNYSVATLAAKGKDYSKSSSLQTRVMLAGATQILGHYQLRRCLFPKFSPALDPNLIRHLTKKDRIKGKRQVY